MNLASDGSYRKISPNNGTICSAILPFRTTRLLSVASFLMPAFCSSQANLNSDSTLAIRCLRFAFITRYTIIPKASPMNSPKSVSSNAMLVYYPVCNICSGNSGVFSWQHMENQFFNHVRFSRIYRLTLAFEED